MKREPVEEQSARDAARAVRRKALLEEWVRKEVAAAPPLTDEQIDRIAALLRGGRK